MIRPPLRLPHFATCLWPGLAELWWRGRLSALPMALIFAFALNWILVARFLYPGWLEGGLSKAVFWLGLIVWVFWVSRSVRGLRALLLPRQVCDRPDRFAQAQAAYLAGDWATAEQLLSETLAIEPRDPPSLLLLCGVYRHTGRGENAEVLLEETRRIEAADGWWLELDAEARRLSRLAQDGIPTVSPSR